MQKIYLNGNVRLRWLFGVPMLLLGGLCMESGHNQQNITTMVAGVWLGVIAIALLAERRFLLVDARSGRLSSKRGIFYPFTVRSFRIADIQHIGLVPYTTRRYRQDDTSGTTRYRLLVNGRLDGILTDLGNRWHARRAGERLCVALGVPFDNAVYGSHSIRNPNELDIPLAERWQRAGEVHERPSLPDGSCVVVDENGPDVLVSWPAETKNRKLVALLTVFITLLGVPLYWNAGSGPRVMLLIFYTIIVMFLALAFLAFSGRSRLTFTTRHVSFRQGRSLFSSSLEFAAIEEWIPEPGGIDLVGDSGRVWFHWPETKGDSEFLQARVAYEISRRTPAAMSRRSEPAHNSALQARKGTGI